MIKFNYVKWAVILIIILGVSFVVYLSYLLKPPQNMSPVETVEYYIEQYNKKNIFKLNSVTYYTQRLNIFDLQWFEEVSLVSCVEDIDVSVNHFDEQWYSNPYKTAKVDVVLEIHHKDGYVSGFVEGLNEWSYDLVKKDEKSPWIIVMKGVI